MLMPPSCVSGVILYLYLKLTYLSPSRLINVPRARLCLTAVNLCDSIHSLRRSGIVGFGFRASIISAYTGVDILDSLTVTLAKSKFLFSVYCILVCTGPTY